MNYESAGRKEYSYCFMLQLALLLIGRVLAIDFGSDSGCSSSIGARKDPVVVLVWYAHESGFWTKACYDRLVLSSISCDVLRCVHDRQVAAERSTRSALFHVPSVFGVSGCDNIVPCALYHVKSKGSYLLVFCIENRILHPSLEHSKLRKQGIDIIADHSFRSDIPITLLTKYYLPRGTVVPDDFFKLSRRRSTTFSNGKGLPMRLRKSKYRVLKMYR